MSVKRVQVYVHRNKESNYDLAQKLGVAVDSEAEKILSYLGSEIELVYDINTQTGHAKLVAAEGRYLGDEQVTSGDLDA